MFYRVWLTKDAEKFVRKWLLGYAGRLAKSGNYSAASAVRIGAHALSYHLSKRVPPADRTDVYLSYPNDKS